MPSPSTSRGGPKRKPSSPFCRSPGMVKRRARSGPAALPSGLPLPPAAAGAPSLVGAGSARGAGAGPAGRSRAQPARSAPRTRTPAFTLALSLGLELLLDELLEDGEGLGSREEAA